MVQSYCFPKPTNLKNTHAQNTMTVWKLRDEQPT